MRREKTAEYLLRIAVMYMHLHDPRELAYRRASKSYLKGSTKYIGTCISFVINQFEAGSTDFFQKIQERVKVYESSRVFEASEFGWGTKPWDDLMGRKLNQR